MNKQSLYLVGGALLASTALTTVGYAATIKAGSDGSNAGAGANPSAYSAKLVATQVFSATTTTANGVIIGAGADTTLTTNNEIFIDLSPTFAAFDLKLDISSSTAAFSTAVAPTLVFYNQTTTGSITEVVTSTSVTGCQPQVSAERLSLLNCNPSANASTASRVDAIGIRGVTYTSAAALRTAGTSITLSGGVFQASTTSTFESITAAVVVTSRDAGSDATVQSGTNATINNNATPVFAQLVSSAPTTATSATIGSVHFSASGAVGTDLSNTFGSFASVASTTEVKITHSVLSDPAFTTLVYNTTTRIASDAVNGSVSFTVASASVTTSAIVVNFNGTTAISETTGSPSATVTPTANTSGGVVTALPAFSGSLATLRRGGLSVELNTILPSAMKASYISFLRIVNQSTVASTATLVVRNDATGDVVGTITTDSIPAGAVGQINSVDIDTKLTAAGATPLTNQSYKVTVSGSFNGYVQSLLFNVVSQVFADASGFRNGTLTTDP